MAAQIVTSGKMTIREYQRIHEWIFKLKGKPSVCDECGTKESKRFEWANMSGKYKKETSDWKRLCNLCHKAKDRVGKPIRNNLCLRGHTLTEDNIYRSPRGDRICKTCKNNYDRAYRISKGVVPRKGIV